MTKSIIKKIHDEIGSLTALSIVNIIFGALSIAMGVSNTVNQLTLLKESTIFSFTSIITICLGVGIGIVGIYWIISSVNILDFTTDIQLKHYKDKMHLTDESIIGLIVQMTAFYRKNKKKIKQMIVVSKIGGCLFIGFALFSVINALVEPSGSVLWSNYVQIIGLILMVFLGIACFFIPRFFVKYASVWDSRMKEAENAEQTLMHQMRS